MLCEPAIRASHLHILMAKLKCLVIRMKPNPIMITDSSPKKKKKYKKILSALMLITSGNVY